MPRLNSNQLAVAFLCAFVALVFLVSCYFNPYYPRLIFSGEDSVGTWMSGTLLVMSATLALVIGIQRTRYFWFCVAAFFLILALDERFMYHEQLKQRIIFSWGNAQPPIWISELPVVIGALIGVGVANLLWNTIQSRNRILLACTVICGILSVVMDIFLLGVVTEDGFKLIAELGLTCLLIRELSTGSA